LVAKSLSVPFYVAVESYKFSRMYPLSQRDVIDLSGIGSATGTATAAATVAVGGSSSAATPLTGKSATASASAIIAGAAAAAAKVKRSFSDLASALPATVAIEQFSIDFTPSKCITLMFTDLGILTPAAVSDELIRLYQ
jgi:translation initiation factor 2B subunit (eIF-2B alpha/beta/delta family)